MTFDELKDALNNLRVPGDSEVYLCLPDAEITVALPYLVRAEREGRPMNECKHGIRRDLISCAMCRCDEAETTLAEVVKSRDYWRRETELTRLTVTQVEGEGLQLLRERDEACYLLRNAQVEREEVAEQHEKAIEQLEQERDRWKREADFWETQFRRLRPPDQLPEEHEQRLQAMQLLQEAAALLADACASQRDASDKALVEAVALLRAIHHGEGADKWPDPVEFRRRVEALVGPPPPSQYTNVPATDTGSGCGGGDLWRLWPESERNKP